MLIDDLKNKRRDELKQIAEDLGLDVGRLSGVKIAEKIVKATGGKAEKLPKKEEQAPHLEDLKPKNKPVVNVYKNEIPEVADLTKEYPSVEALKKELEPYIERGLKVVNVDKNTWHVRHGMLEDSGSMFMSLKGIVKCVRILMRL